MECQKVMLTTTFSQQKINSLKALIIIGEFNTFFCQEVAHCTRDSQKRVAIVIPLSFHSSSRIALDKSKHPSRFDHSLFRRHIISVDRLSTPSLEFVIIAKASTELEEEKEISGQNYVKQTIEKLDLVIHEINEDTNKLFWLKTIIFTFQKSKKLSFRGHDRHT